MKDSNQVFIKINYQGKENQGIDNPQKTELKPQMVNEWNVKRIVITVILLFFLIIFLVYFFSDEEEVSKSQQIMVEQKKEQSVELESTPSLINKKVQVKKSSRVDDIKKMEPIASTVDKNIIKGNKEIKKPFAVVSHPKVSRALLTLGLNNKEPLDSISSFITVNSQRATGLFYFTEIIDMKGQRLAHHWLWNNQLVYKKSFSILGNRWRAATSKLIPFSKAGKWMVKLVNEKGVSLNEIKFEVIKE